MELVSVILPAFNAAPFIADALESVLAQTYDNLEIIIVDDGSTDDTEKVVSRYEGIRYIYQQNRGAGAARNRGLCAANGEYIAFIDADDLWLSEKIKVQVDLLRQSKFKWCYCDSYFSWYGSEKVIGKLSDTQGTYEGDVLIPYVSGQISIPLPSALIRREVLEDVGYFDESLRTEEHTDLWARIAVNYPIGYINQPLVQIRKRLDSLKQLTEPAVTGHNRRQVLKKLMYIAPERLEPIKKMLMASSHANEGKHFLRYGDISKARRCFRKAIRLSPTSMKLYFFWCACWFEPIPKLFYRLRWILLHNHKATIRPGWWVNQK